MKRTILLIPLLFVLSIHIRAQSVGPATINSAGRTAIIGGNEFEWSVGEMAMISTLSTPGIIITQGVLQPAGGGLKTSGPLSGKLLQVFPNPATSVVNILYTSATGNTLSYRLMDMTGRTITTSQMPITQASTSGQLYIADLACATYMLEVTVSNNNGTSESTSYKIQKLK